MNAKGTVKLDGMTYELSVEIYDLPDCKTVEVTYAKNGVWHEGNPAWREVVEIVRNEKINWLTCRLNEFQSCLRIWGYNKKTKKRESKSECNKDHLFLYDGSARWADDSFTHAFGIERCGHVDAEVEDMWLCLYEYDNASGENVIRNVRKITEKGVLGARAFEHCCEMLCDEWEPSEPDYE